MYVLVAYDVSVEGDGGRRLRKIAKICTRYGQRVQNSLFECLVTKHELLLMRKAMLEVMDESVDSLRIYNLGDNWQRRVESYGTKESYDVTGALVF